MSDTDKDAARGCCMLGIFELSGDCTDMYTLQGFRVCRSLFFIYGKPMGICQEKGKAV